MKENVKTNINKNNEYLKSNEYYNMQSIFDNLYDKSKRNEKHTKLKNIILSDENILLAYRNIKQNIRSKTSGIDGQTIHDIEKLSQEKVIQKVRNILQGKNNDYIPKAVKRKEIQKSNGETQPLGIPCIWDRLIQQCICQVLEPICEAKFSNHNYGYRPGRNAHHAIGEITRLIERSHMFYVVEFGIKDFFDNVNHRKLIAQLWTLGVQDKWLLYIIKKILKSPIRLENGMEIKSFKGISQCGIISPLLTNITLNELDRWIESQWEENPVVYKYKLSKNAKGTIIKSHGYLGMRRKTKLKEMYIVRYADEIRIFTNSQENAEKIMYAMKDWVNMRLHLQVSSKKTKIVNLKKKYTYFLGFKFKAQRKRKGYICKSHMDEKALKKSEKKLKEQIIKVSRPANKKGQYNELIKYNMMVLGIQNYYCAATCINEDLNKINRTILLIIKNRFGKQITKSGTVTDKIAIKFKKSGMLRYIKGINIPVIPIGYVKYKKNLSLKKDYCIYTEKGRSEIYKKPIINYKLLDKISTQQLYNQSIEYMNNRISLFVSQNGKCAITGIPFNETKEIHCHHIVPKKEDGTDEYSNLILINEKIHKLIHATKKETIQKLLSYCDLNKSQLQKVNELRKKVKLKEI